VETVGLRELRQQASELVRRVEAGERVVITVSGRPAAVLTPPARSAWRTFDEIAELFDGRGDAGWHADRDRLDGEPRDPWPTA
jgi:prevent-host-death family protein